MLIKKILQQGKDKLKNNSHSANLDTELFLCFVLNKSKEFLYTNPEYKLTNKQVAKFQELIKRRAKGEPVAYITNQKEFFGLDFYVNKNVLIPRPETELLVEESLRLICDSRSTIRNIAEIGTGSGCIIISLIKKINVMLSLSKSEIYFFATDICAKALSVAKKNAKQYKVLSKIKFYQGDLLEPIKNKKIDILIANLPYLPKSHQEKSIQSEPKKALYADEKGLKLYRQLLEQVKELNYQPKYLLFEHDPRQTADFKKLIKQILPNSKLQIKKDLAGLDRVMMIKL